MTKEYIIGVGGVGTKCLLAYLNLKILGVGQEFGGDRPPLPTTKFLVVDTDANPYVDPALQALQNYQIYRKHIYSEGNPSVHGPLRHDLRFVGQNEALNAYSEDQIKARRLVWRMVERLPDLGKENLNTEAAMGGSHPVGSAFFHPDYYSKLPIAEGFYGLPSLGSSVFSLTVDPAHPGKQDDLYAQLEADIARDGKDPITIQVIGSIFGGTGSSVIPQLARNLRQRFHGKTNLRLHAICLEPYFQVPIEKVEQNGSSEDLLVAPLLRPKAMRERALCVLQDFQAGSGYDDVTLLGEPECVSMPKFAPKGSGQDNPPLPLELIAALRAIDYEAPIAASAAAMDQVNTSNPAYLCRSNAPVWDQFPLGSRRRSELELQLACSLLLAREYFDIARHSKQDNHNKTVLGYLNFQDDAFEWFLLSSIRASQGIDALKHYDGFWPVPAGLPLGELKDVLYQDNPNVQEEERVLFRIMKYPRICVNMSAPFLSQGEEAEICYPDGSVTVEALKTFIAKWWGSIKAFHGGRDGGGGGLPLLAITKTDGLTLTLGQVHKGVGMGTHTDMFMQEYAVGNPRPCLFPTAWGTAQDLVLRLRQPPGKTFPGNPGDPENEWLGLLWGAFRGRFEPALVCGDHLALEGKNAPNEVAQAPIARAAEFYLVRSGKAERAVVPRDLVWALRKTCPAALTTREPMVLFFLNHQGHEVILGGHDSRTLGWLVQQDGRGRWQKMLGQDTKVEICPHLHLKKVVDKSTNLAKTFLWLDIAQAQLDPAWPEFLGFLARLTPTDKTVAGTWQSLVSTLGNPFPNPTLKAHAWSTQAAWPQELGAWVQPDVAGPLWVNLLQTYLRPAGATNDFLCLQLPTMNPGELLEIAPGSAVLDPATRTPTFFSGNPHLPQGRLDPVAMFVSDHAFLLPAHVSADYRPLKPEVLKHFNRDQILEYFKPLTPDGNDWVMNVELPTRDQNRPFKFSVRFSDNTARKYRDWTAIGDLGAGLSALIWPPFKEDDWDLYLLQLANRPEALGLRAHGGVQGGDSFDLPLTAPRMQRITRWPDFLELTYQDARYGGFFVSPRQTLQPPQDYAALALDLGSSNSTLAYLAHGHVAQATPLPLHPNGVQVLVNTEKSIGVGDRWSFLGKPQGNDQEISQVPSMAIVGSKKAHTAFEDFFPVLTALGWGFPKSNMKAGSSDQRGWHWLTNVKWGGSEQMEAFASSLTRFAQGVVSVQQGHLCRFDRFVFTYPLSAQANLANTYGPAMKQAAAGIRTNLATISLNACSESEANSRYLALNPGLNGYLMLLDMGGGTTDFSVLHNGIGQAFDSLGPRHSSTHPFNGFFGGKTVLTALSNTVAALRGDTQKAKDWNAKYNKWADDTKTMPPVHHIDRILFEALDHAGYLANRQLDCHSVVEAEKLLAAMEVLFNERIGELSLDAYPVLRARIAILLYLMVYYGSVLALAVYRTQKLSPLGINLGDPEFHARLAGAGWLTSRFGFGSAPKWAEALFELAVTQAWKNYLGTQIPAASQKVQFAVPPAGIMNQHPKFSVALGALTGGFPPPAPGMTLFAHGGHVVAPSACMMDPTPGEWNAAWNPPAGIPTTLQIPCPIPEVADVEAAIGSMFTTDRQYFTLLCQEFARVKGDHDFYNKETLKKLQSSGLSTESPLVLYLEEVHKHYLSASFI